MSRLRLLYSLGLLAFATACGARPAHPGHSLGIEEHPGVRDLYRFAEEQRTKHDWPALGVGIIHRGKVAGLGMAGERKLGSGNWAALGDPFDAASCAKSVTAMVAAMLVEEGKLGWHTRAIDLFPEWRQTIRPAYADVTLEQLLGHRSGLDRWMSTNERWSEWQRDHRDQSATGQRLRFATTALQRPPRHPPGSEFYYCNDGYLIAGTLLEKVAGQPYEELARQRVFGPLGMTSAGFGLALAPDNAVVWGHEPRSLGRTRAIAPGPDEYGRTPFGSPAGFLSSSLPDLLRYVDAHIQGANGKSTLLKRSAFDRLHAPLPRQQYALGWEVETKRDATGKVLERSIYHGGYSGSFRANLWFCPETQWGTVIVCNHGRGDGAEMSAVFLALLKEFRLLEAAPK